MSRRPSADCPSGLNPDRCGRMPIVLGAPTPTLPRGLAQLIHTYCPPGAGDGPALLSPVVTWCMNKMGRGREAGMLASTRLASFLGGLYKVNVIDSFWSFIRQILMELQIKVGKGLLTSFRMRSARHPYSLEEKAFAGRWAPATRGGDAGPPGEPPVSRNKDHRTISNQRREVQLRSFCGRS